MNESDYVPEIDDLTDAMIEDTTRCKVCGASFQLGGNDGVIIEGPNAAICIECAAEIYKEYEKALVGMCICEHGIADSDWCVECDKKRQASLERYWRAWAEKKRNRHE